MEEVKQILISEEENWIVATDTGSGVSSQGKTDAEALKNLSEALELYYEDNPGMDDHPDADAENKLNQKEILISGRSFDITVPGTIFAAYMVIYRDKATGVASLRLVNDIVLENGAVADGQEDKLISAYLDNWDEKPGGVTVDIPLDDEMTTFLEELKEVYGVSRYAFETGLSKYLCNRDNLKRFKESLEKTLKASLEEKETLSD